MPPLDYIHVDVFSAHPFSGNSLPVFLDANGLSGTEMLRITQELRHFEAIFLRSTDRVDTMEARIFDLFGELPFAGHPLLGAAAALHDRSGSADDFTWRFMLGNREVTVAVERTAIGFSVRMDQGAPEFLTEVGGRDDIAHAFSLSPTDLDPDLPCEVVSTGLRYLIVPVRPDALAWARVASDLTSFLMDRGAQFAVLFDKSGMEVRHWNNDGIMEDVATGSAAGTIGAFCLKHGIVVANESFVLHQGRHTGRPSQLRVIAEGSRDVVTTVKVGGDVAVVGRGTLEARPGLAEELVHNENPAGPEVQIR